MAFLGRYRYFKIFKSFFLLHYQKYDVFYAFTFFLKIKKSGFIS